LGNEISSSIINYAETQKADFICTGARGNSVLAKVFGSVAVRLITTSAIPVLVVPKSYRVTSMQNICYASDMANLESEMGKVMKLASILPAKIKVLHFDYEVSLKENLGKWNNASARYTTEGIEFQYKKSNALTPLNDHLRKAITDLKPNLLVLFTRQGRNWYERLILSSKSAELSFTAKVPLLVYRKDSN
jgi:nucleotide-binding universal stress UspA family protein